MSGKGNSIKSENRSVVPWGWEQGLFANEHKDFSGVMERFQNGLWG